MVDFQSRDTRVDEEGDDPDEGPDAEETDEHDERGHEDHEHEHEHEDTHDHHHHDVESVGVAVLTVSTSRSLDDDPAGDAVGEAFRAAGHHVVTRELVRDSYDRVQAGIDDLASRDGVDVVVTTGGTGVTPDDVTVEAAEPLFNKELPGFGELFRLLSYEEIAERVVATRATAGVSDGVLVFCLPGSENAARLGSEQVIVPEIGHLVGLASREH